MIKATLEFSDPTFNRRVPEDPIVFECEPQVGEVIMWGAATFQVQGRRHVIKADTNEATLVLVVK
jgi:hypothetical protein